MRQLSLVESRIEMERLLVQYSNRLFLAVLLRKALNAKKFPIRAKQSTSHGEPKDLQTESKKRIFCIGVVDISRLTGSYATRTM